MNTSVKIGLALVLACGPLAVFSAWQMAERVRMFNLAEAADRFHFEPTSQRNFEFAGRKVSFEDTRTEAGTSAVKLTYGDKSVLLEVKDPPAALPDLLGYSEWLRPLYFAPIKDGVVAVDWRNSQGVRLAVVNRTTAGYDERTWGSVRVKDWIFDVLELKADGTIEQKRMQFRDRRGRLPAAQADPKTDILAIDERTWQWQAALYAVPRLQVSRYRFGSDAVDGNEGTPGMGWTLPATGFAGMGMFVGIGLLMAGSVRRSATAVPAVGATPPAVAGRA
jgi:hypothetical protein